MICEHYNMPCHAVCQYRDKAAPWGAPQHAATGGTSTHARCQSSAQHGVGRPRNVACGDCCLVAGLRIYKTSLALSVDWFIAQGFHAITHNLN